LAKYLVEMPHTKETCLQSLDEMAEKGSDLLGSVWFGCDMGDHTGYALLDADDEHEVKDMLPNPMINTARVVEVKRHTPEEVRAMHQM